MLRGLFEGALYNSEAGAKCTVYLRARTKQGRGVIKEIRYIILGMCSFQHKWASECQLYLFVLFHHVIMKCKSVV